MSDTEFPKKGASGNRTSTMYSVEARAVGAPQKVGDQLFGAKWQSVSFTRVPAPFGVASSIYDDHVGTEHGLHAYGQAQALRWWFQSQLHFTSIETRLVSHTVKSTYEITAIDSHAYISPVNRSDILPEWNGSSHTDRSHEEIEAYVLEEAQRRAAKEQS